MYSKIELEEAQKAVNSTLAKCEKSLSKVKVGSSQHTLLTRRVKALSISLDLIEKQLVQQS